GREKKMTSKQLCPICGGFFEKGTTTFTVDYKAGVVVVRNVTAFVCDQCGEAWLDDQTAQQLEHIVDKAKKEKNEFQVIQMAA
ncbi:MAG: type II toxin-antitoxin system MqsA family antitoxin, partial [Thermodesulfobacteriota bacterium]